MQKLNDKLDEFEPMPRNRSEPRMKYYPSPDFRPEAMEKLDEEQRRIFLQKKFQLEHQNIPWTGYCDYDANQIMEEKEKLKNFLSYRKQFEMSQ